jgi:CDP-glycerol glycerophosphotransferase
MRVVYNSFAGQYSDSPRSIYERLAAREDRISHVWIAHPARAASFPPHVRTVPAGSDACRRALESADVVVSNTHIELDWEKSPSTVYLQTWHGTPLKHIHYDVLWAPPGRLDYLSQDVRRWDHLLSPNAVSTPRLRGAFGFTGPVLESGYPRNDILSAPDRDAVRLRTRRDLGIGDDKTVVLYTPTWREDLVDENGEQDFRLHLDLEELTRRLGPDTVILLRLHYMVSGRLGPCDIAGVQDVSFHRDVTELYLAADAMVTDYSSTMFDFAITGKPMVFYTYDLEHYRGTLRGFYFDFEPSAPGPIVETTAAVADALADLDGLKPTYARRYADFQRTFCDLEDGNATTRVLDRFFPVEESRPDHVRRDSGVSVTVPGRVRGRNRRERPFASQTGERAAVGSTSYDEYPAPSDHLPARLDGSS